MRIWATLITTITLSLLTYPVWASVNINVHEKFALNAVFECYNQAIEVGPEFGKCVLKKLDTIADPENYRINFYRDSADKNISRRIDILIFNKVGHQLHCIGTSSQTINIQSCTNREGAILTHGQLLSITPP